jgi:hypothetical protein
MRRVEYLNNLPNHEKEGDEGGVEYPLLEGGVDPVGPEHVHVAIQRQTQWNHLGIG